jgi:hypothetical protein
MEATVVAQIKFDIPNTYKFHQKKSIGVEVDWLRASRQFDKNDKMITIKARRRYRTTRE